MQDLTYHGWLLSYILARMEVSALVFLKEDVADMEHDRHLGQRASWSVELIDAAIADRKLALDV